MNQTIKMIAIALAAALVGGGLVIGGMKLAAPSEKSQTTQRSGGFATNDGGQAAPMQAAPAGIGAAPTPSAPTGGAAAPAPRQTGGTAPAPTQQQATGGSGTDAQLRALLTSTAWCSFSYSGSSTYTGGYGDSTSTSRFVFYSNGTFSGGSSSETYNSGGNGQYYGAGGGGASGQWKISNTRLLLANDETGGQFVDANASLTYNSNGSPIITAGGVEYYSCN